MLFILLILSIVCLLINQSNFLFSLLCSILYRLFNAMSCIKKFIYYLYIIIILGTLYIICFERLEILDFNRLRRKYASEISNLHNKALYQMYKLKSAVCS